MKGAGGLQSALRWVTLSGLLLTAVLPRFNLRDPEWVRSLTASATATPYGVPVDVEGYIRLGQYFRREMPADSLIPPYCYRPLVPLAASLLPFDVQTSINLINILCLLVAMGVLDQVLRLAGFSGRRRNLGCALFAFSFPSFYYGAIGFVDPAAVLVTTLLAYLTLRERHGLFAATLILGVLVKETNGLMALLPAAWAWAQARMTGEVVKRTAVLVALAGATVLGMRVLSPFPEPDWFWVPRFDLLRDNLSRPRALLSLALTLGLPGALALAATISGRTSKILGPARSRFFQSGAGLALGLYLWTWFTAYADGRVIWIAYPFLIPLALASGGSKPLTRFFRVLHHPVTTSTRLMPYRSPAEEKPNGAERSGTLPGGPDASPADRCRGDADRRDCLRGHAARAGAVVRGRLGYVAVRAGPAGRPAGPVVRDPARMRA